MSISNLTIGTPKTREKREYVRQDLSKVDMLLLKQYFLSNV